MRQTRTKLLDPLINFFLYLQHLFLLLQLRSSLLLILSLLDQFILRSLLVFEVFGENGVTCYDFDLLAHRIYYQQLYYSTNLIIIEFNQYKFKAFTSQSAGGINFW